MTESWKCAVSLRGCLMSDEGFDVVCRVFLSQMPWKQSHGCTINYMYAIPPCYMWNFLPDDWRISILLPHSHRQDSSFNNLQNEGGLSKVIRATLFNPWNTVIREAFWNKEEQFMFALKSRVGRQQKHHRTLFIRCVYTERSIHAKKQYVHYVYSMTVWRKNNNK